MYMGVPACIAPALCMCVRVFMCVHVCKADLGCFPLSVSILFSGTGPLTELGSDSARVAVQAAPGILLSLPAWS